MATLALHFPVGEVTLAQRLYGMLKTCETKADFSVWCGDYQQYSDVLSEADRHSLVAVAVKRERDVRRAA